MTHSAATVKHLLVRRASCYDGLLMAPKPNVELFRDVQRIAAARGGRCLEKVYLRIAAPMRFECADGHRWTTQGRRVRSEGTWCPTCAGQAPFTLASARALARRHGGECLSSSAGTKRPLRWRCARGHEWAVRVAKIRAGSWCPRCAGRPSLPALKDFAEQRGGRCLSRRYINCDAPMRWQCEAGHRFTVSWRLIKDGRWCLDCKAHTNQRTLASMKAIAAARGGVCLASELHGMSHRLRWRCSEGHEWTAQATTIRRGRWCPTCGEGRLGIERMRQVAWERGGQCLSAEYQNLATHLAWECRKGHRWTASPGNIIHRESWCPTCSLLERRGRRKENR